MVHQPSRACLRIKGIKYAYETRGCRKKDHLFRQVVLECPNVFSKTPVTLQQRRESLFALNSTVLYVSTTPIELLIRMVMENPACSKKQLTSTDLISNSSLASHVKGLQIYARWDGVQEHPAAVLIQFTVWARRMSNPLPLLILTD